MPEATDAFPPHALDALASARVVAVVGLSHDPAKPSHRVAMYLRKHGYRVVGVNPNCGEAGEGRCAASLLEVGQHVDVVDVFLRPERVPAVARDAAAIGAGMLWLQEGVASAESERIAREAGMPFVQDRCVMKAHMALLARGEKR